MKFAEFSRLSQSEQRIYTEMLRGINEYKCEFRFTAGGTADVISRVFKAVLRDNPHIFWFDGNGKITWTTVDGRITDICLKADFVEGVTASILKSMVTRLDKTVDLIASRAKEKKHIFETVLYIHDYIAHTTDYSLKDKLCYTAYGCLVGYSACCAGYSKAFQLICERIGIDCGYVSGTSTEQNSIHGRHAWNYINLGGEYYFIDITWDDPAVIGEGRSSGNVTREYFGLTEQELKRTHVIDRKYFVPSCTGTKYNYYNFMHFYVMRYSFNEVKAIAEAQLRTKESFTVKFSTVSECKAAEVDLFDKCRVYDIKGIASRISYSVSKSGLIITVRNK